MEDRARRLDVRLALSLLLLASCPRAAAPVNAVRCATFSEPRSVGAVPERLVELSGLVASRSSPWLYAHNDSGDAARFFSLSSADGSIVREFVLPGAVNIDWEDIALVACPAGRCVVLADLGDNRRLRDDYAIYRVTEPTLASDAGLSFERFDVRYPNGEHHNAEAVVSDHDTGRLYVLTKEGKGVPSQVFRFPLPLASGVLEPVTTLAVPTATDTQVTAADVSPSGDALLVRLYNRLLIARRAPGASFESLFTAPFAEVPVADEAQGEAVAFFADGGGFFTASESPKTQASLFMSACQ